MKKLIKKIMSWSQEARVGAVVAVVALFLIGGISLARNWWAPVTPPNPSTSSSSTQNTTTSSSSIKDEVILPIEEIIENPFEVNAVIARGYYDLEASIEDRADAMVFYDGTYKCSQGLDFVFENKEFNVLAASSGTVKDIAVDSIYGLTVTVTCVNDIEMVYASLKSSNLQVGDEIVKGDIIGVSGESIYGSELDCPILHFRVYKNGQVINPKNCFGQSLKNVQ